MKIENGLQCPLSTFSTPQQDSNLAASHEQTCRGNLFHVPRITGYGVKLLDTIGSLQRHTAGELYTLCQETSRPL
jgi:hypothetical protein